jgi:phosphoglycolate phosphatase
LAAAANAMLTERGLAPLAPETVRDFIGQGIGPLVWRCLNAAAAVTPEDSRFEEALECFAAHYGRLNGVAARPFPGVVEGLERMRQAKLRLACVTNKAMRFTRPLLEKTDLARYFDAVVTSDDVTHRKPHPEPFLLACGRLGAVPPATIVIGDSANDAQGARAAGCRVLLVPYGYREGRELGEIECDGVVTSLAHAAETLTRPPPMAANRFSLWRKA